jgi:hypothetical protein
MDTKHLGVRILYHLRINASNIWFILVWERKPLNSRRVSASAFHPFEICMTQPLGLIRFYHAMHLDSFLFRDEAPSYLTTVSAIRDTAEAEVVNGSELGFWRWLGEMPSRRAVRTNLIIPSVFFENLVFVSPKAEEGKTT